MKYLFAMCVMLCVGCGTRDEALPSGFARDPATQRVVERNAFLNEDRRIVEFMTIRRLPQGASYVENLELSQRKGLSPRPWSDTFAVWLKSHQRESRIIDPELATIPENARRLEQLRIGIIMRVLFAFDRDHPHFAQLARPAALEDLALRISRYTQRYPENYTEAHPKERSNAYSQFSMYRNMIRRVSVPMQDGSGRMVTTDEEHRHFGYSLPHAAYESVILEWLRQQTGQPQADIGYGHAIVRTWALHEFVEADKYGERVAAKQQGDNVMSKDSLAAKFTHVVMNKQAFIYVDGDQVMPGALYRTAP